MKLTSGLFFTCICLCLLGQHSVISGHLRAGSRRQNRLFFPPFIFRPNFLRRFSAQLINSVSEFTDSLDDLEERVEELEGNTQDLESSLEDVRNDVEDLEDSLPQATTLACEEGRPSDAMIFDGRCLQYISDVDNFDAASDFCENIQGGSLFFLTGEDLDDDDFLEDLRNVFPAIPAAGEFWVDGIIDNGGDDIQLGGGLEIEDTNPRWISTADFTNDRIIVRSNNANPDEWAIEPQDSGEDFAFICRFPTSG